MSDLTLCKVHVVDEDGVVLLGALQWTCVLFVAWNSNCSR